MTDESSSFIALYSALIQGGAAVIVVLAAFVFGAASAGRGGRRITSREFNEARNAQDELLAKIEANTARMTEANEKLREHHRQLLVGKLSRSESETIRQGIDKEFAIYTQEHERLASEYAQRIDRLRQLYDVKIDSLQVNIDATHVVKVTVVLIYFCIVLPAFSLALLPNDNMRTARAYVVASAYALAMLKLLDVTQLFAHDDDTREQRGKSVQRVVTWLLILLAVAFVTMALIPWQAIGQTLYQQVVKEPVPVGGTPTLTGTPVS
jgi:hypothetical protein